MLDWIALSTHPVEAVITIVLLGLAIVGLRWAANRSKSKVSLDAAPEVILRQHLKFGDEDLEQNRSGTISPRQIKRIRNEFLILLIPYTVMIVLFGVSVAAMFSADSAEGRVDLLFIGALIFIGLMSLLMIWIAVSHLGWHIQDLKTKKAVALVSPLVFAEHVAEYMVFKFPTHQYRIMVNIPQLPQPVPLEIGFMSEDVLSQVKKLSHQTAIIYLSANTSKVLSFELASTKPDMHQKDVR
jgi:hypothetical protein